jgi:uncharacterized membrane protein YphA (DoxX/SURF4 family)
MEILLKTARAFYGIGIAALGIQQLIYADFRPVILPSWPSWMHASAILANIVGAALIAAGIFTVLGKKERVVSLFLGGFFLYCPLISNAPTRFSSSLIYHTIWPC